MPTKRRPSFFLLWARSKGTGRICACSWIGSRPRSSRASSAARQLPLAPARPYGVATLAAAWRGTVSLSTPLATRLVVEAIGALGCHGFRRFALVSHQLIPTTFARWTLPGAPSNWGGGCACLARPRRQSRDVESKDTEMYSAISTASRRSLWGRRVQRSSDGSAWARKGSGGGSSPGRPRVPCSSLDAS